VAVLAVVAALVALAAGCVSNKDVREAEQSVYDADFATVFNETVTAVRELYPTLDDDPRNGIIKTAWHQVRFSNDSDDPKTVRARDRAAGLDSPTATQSALGGQQSLAMTRTFIRFDVTVMGGRPWRIRVIGKAAEWEPGNAVPSEMRGASKPAWLEGRTDALVVAIHDRLKAYARKAPKQAAPVAVAEPENLAPFGPIPEAAARTLAAVRRALNDRDNRALRQQLADDVVWSLGAEPGADTAITMWQADPDTLTQMRAALAAGCRPDGATRVACPPAATEQPGYVGWRLLLEKRGAAWKVTAFVQGD